TPHGRQAAAPLSEAANEEGTKRAARAAHAATSLPDRSDGRAVGDHPHGAASTGAGAERAATDRSDARDPERHLLPGEDWWHLGSTSARPPTPAPGVAAGPPLERQ